MTKRRTPKEVPIAAQRKILELEQRVFKLERQLAKTKTKYEKQIAGLRGRPRPVMTEEERLKLIERRNAALRVQKS